MPVLSMELLLPEDGSAILRETRRLPWPMHDTLIIMDEHYPNIDSALDTYKRRTHTMETDPATIRDLVLLHNGENVTYRR